MYLIVLIWNLYPPCNKPGSYMGGARPSFGMTPIKIFKKNLKSRCHTKRRVGAATRTCLSFGMTTIQFTRDLFPWCPYLSISVKWSPRNFTKEVEFGILICTFVSLWALIIKRITTPVWWRTTKYLYLTTLTVHVVRSELSSNCVRSNFVFIFERRGHPSPLQGRSTFLFDKKNKCFLV